MKSPFDIGSPDSPTPDSLHSPGVRGGGMQLLGKLLLLFGILYIFILAISLLGASFKLMGAGVANTLFTATSNPLVGLAIGILSTVIIQSSSTTTAIVVGLVGAGTLGFENAVPIIMGANAGTSVTNTIVSLANINRREDFKRAFAGSTVHDFFNFCSIALLLPLEIQFGLISKSALYVESHLIGFGGLTFNSPLKLITKPVVAEIIDLLGKRGWLTAVIALILLFLSLKYITQVMRSMLMANIEQFFERVIFRNAALGFTLGIVLTVMVQSSSITTSLVVPLLGAGIITLRHIYPYVLGANIGTTVTAFLASFAIGAHAAVAIAFAHFLFNIFGTAVFWPLKSLPIFLAERLAEYSQRSRLIPFLYILIFFVILPGAIILIMG
jgi:solute carrier family 34 (sodium-dependent phosphate cotransporter)